MHPHGRLAQAERLADFAGALVGDVTHREHRALTIRQLLDRGGDVAGALGGEHAIFRARLHGRRIGRRRFDRRRHRERPAQPAGARLSQIQTPIDEDAGEPHLEGVFLSIARDVREHFDERVLHRLVGVVRVAQVAVGDTNRAPLMLRDEIGELLPRTLAFAGQHQRLEACRQRRIP